MECGSGRKSYPGPDDLGADTGSEVWAGGGKLDQSGGGISASSSDAG